MKIFDEIKKISPHELEAAGIVKPAKVKGTYICPFCGNGTGESGDGLSVTQQSWGYNFHCFGKCGGKNYTAVDLIQTHYGLKELWEVAKVAEKEFKLPDFSSFNENKKVAAPSTAQATENTPKKNYTEFYQLAQSQLESFIESKGGKYRGLPFEDLRKVGAGIATAADLKSVGENVPASAKCLILPYSSKRFLMRSISDNPKIKRGNTGGKKTEIYNPFSVDFEKPFFVVEGEIDCLSIHKAGFPAVALSGAGEYKILIRYLDGLKIDNKSDVRIILLLDNNDSGAGQKGAQKALSEIKAAGYSAVNFILSPKEKYDANEYLQKDSEGLQARLAEIHRKANKEFSKISGVEVLADVFDELDEVSEKMQGNLLKWGFPKLDEKLPLLPGCYLLGALPSLGKTTFALNVAENICESGTPILYVNYESTAKQIAAKTLAGYWFKKVWENHRDNRLAEKVPTANDLMLGRYNSMFGIDEMKKVREELKGRRRNCYFFQGKRESVQDLISKIKTYVDNGAKFIVIDYVQLIKGTDTSKTAREQIDETIRELQIFQSQNDLVMLFISSFNRENYRNYACLESFKESGGLEYTADTILALQFECENEKERTNIETFQKKKQAQPRDMELVCLKNRFGTDFTDKFTYHSAHETFIEKILKIAKFEDSDEVDEE